LPKNYPIPENESERLDALRRFHILDTLPESQYDDLVKVAAHITDVPIAVLSLLDEDRQWFKSITGLDVQQTGRDVAFCGHTIMFTDRPLIVEDATKDDRFVHNDLVTGDPHIRFYAGVPLVSDDGFAIGALCVIDRKPRTLNDAQIEVLNSLSRIAMSLIKTNIINEAQDKLIEERTHDLILSNEKVEKAYAAKSNFMMNMSHEMRTPLHAILNYAKLGMDRMGVWDSEKQRANLVKIRTTANRLGQMIDKLLDLTSIESVTGGIEKQSVLVDDIIHRALSEVISIQDLHTITTLIPQAISSRKIMADPVFLAKALSQVLKNAAQYSPSKSEIELILALNNEANQIIITVRDQGIGIPYGEEEAIFEKFSQSSATISGAGGTGIGLSLASAIINAHGGTIKAANNDGDGACFTLSVAI